MRMASRLYSELRRQGIEEISFEVEAVRRAFPAMAKAADELRERQHPSEWSAAFSKLLQHAGWPGDRPLNPAEHQAVEHWKNLLSELAALDVVLPAHHIRPGAPAAAPHRPRSALRSAR